MPYATVDDMITRYGEQEMLELSTPVGMDMDMIHVDRVNTAIADAGGVIDSYLRRRYVVPTDSFPEIVRACCDIARLFLATTGCATPSEKMIVADRSARSWLKKVQDGDVTLDGEAVANPSDERAAFQGRPCVLRGSVWP